MVLDDPVMRSNGLIRGKRDSANLKVAQDVVSKIMALLDL